MVQKRLMRERRLNNIINNIILNTWKGNKKLKGQYSNCTSCTSCKVHLALDNGTNTMNIASL